MSTNNLTPYDTGDRLGPQLWPVGEDRDRLSGAAALEADGAGLQADVATVYAPTPFTPSKGVRLARPRLGEPPNLIVRAPWWTPDAYASGLAPRLLACADALGSGDPRAAATAREVMADDPDLRRLLAT